MVTAKRFRLIYPYRCVACKHQFEVIKSVKRIDDPENCEKCGSVSERTIAVSQSFSGANDWDTAHYSPAFGKVVKNNREARRLAKERGWVEVGNESVEKIHSRYDKERREKSERGYKEVVDSLTNLGEIGS